MTDRNGELVPDNWSLVRERALTTGLCLEGWYSEHSGVCRRAEPQITLLRMRPLPLLQLNFGVSYAGQCHFWLYVHFQVRWLLMTVTDIFTGLFS